MSMNKQKGIFTSLLVFLLVASALPSEAAASLDRAELSDSIISYMKAEYLGENLAHLARSELQVETRDYLKLDPLPEDETALKIASTNAVETESLYDYYVGIFSHLSNMPLMQMDSEGNLVGQSAERYEVSADNTEWTFYIKDDLYWSDGRKVTPEDVEFSFTYLAENFPDTAGWIEEDLESTSVSDEDNSVTFTFKQPYTNINLEFATYNLVPKHIWENITDPEQYTSKGPYVGCGPYFLEEVNLDSATLTFRKNPHWKSTDPNFGRIEIHLYANDNVASLALENGEADTYYKYASSYPYASIESLEETGNFKLYEKEGFGLTFLGMNLKETPLSDSAFREAIAYAIDYEQIIESETLGYGKVANKGFVPPGMSYYKDTEQLEYNVTKAREILEAAGYTDNNQNGIYEGTDGNDISLRLLIRSGYEDPGKFIKGDLEAAGIGVEIESVDPSTWFEKKDNYDYDLTISGATPWGMLMHANWGTGYLDSRRTGKGVLHILGDPEFQGLCDNILATTDSDELEDYASDVQDYYAEELPIIALYWKDYVIPYNKEFTGWHYSPIFGIYNLDTFLNVKKTAS
jgi:peptide/nickel transport system substrate-binding protein